jgi:ribosomal protein S18 acetylase RimI-like enzyme
VVTVETATGRRGRQEFVAVAPPLYAGTAWVRPLDAQILFRLDRNRDPFWQHAEGELLLARRRGQGVGRLLVIEDRLLADTTGERLATFGLFEAPPERDVARELFAAAERWARKRGLVGLLGPFFLSIHDEVGMLVRGFAEPPCVLMPYGREYYPELLHQSGFTPVREFDAWEWNCQQQAVPEPGPLRPGIRIRDFDRRGRREEIGRFLRVYNAAFAGNWGFVPMTTAEAETMVGDFLRFADLALPKFAEVDGEPAGFILALPDFNQLLSRCGGSLWPTGFFRLLWGRAGLRTGRVITLAVHPDFRDRGIVLQLIRHTWTAARSRGYGKFEFGYVDAQNRGMRKLMERLGARAVKTYHLYRRDFSGAL